MINNNFISHEGMNWGAARIVLDLPYKNAINHINAAFYKPTDTVANTLSHTFSNRVQNFALGILLLIPLINIVVELALRIFSTNQSAPLNPPVARSVNPSFQASPKTGQPTQPTVRTSVNDDRVMRCLSTSISMEVTSISSQIIQKTSEPPRAIYNPVESEIPPNTKKNSPNNYISTDKVTPLTTIIPPTQVIPPPSNDALLQLERKRKIEQEIAAQEEEWEEEEEEARRKREEELIQWTIMISQQTAMDQNSQSGIF